MDSSKLPKNLSMFLDQIYKDYPAVEKHPDYNFYYLYIDNTSKNTYLFCVIDDYLSNSNLSNRLNESLNNLSSFFGIDESTIISSSDFEAIKDKITKTYLELRKTSSTIIFYPVW